MAALDFPNAPALNDTYTANGRTFEWNGEAWLPVSGTFINDGSFVFYDGPLNVGIGTQTPSTKLEVVGTITATQIAVTSASGITIDGNNVWHAGNDGAGSGLNADLLDGIDSLQFLRSDEADTMSQNTVATATLTVQNTNGFGTGTGTGAVVAEFGGDTNTVAVQNISAGSYGIYNTATDSGIELMSGTTGVIIVESGVDAATFTDTASTINGSLTVGSATAPSVTLDLDGTDALQLTVGTTAQRPTGAAGMIRYNSTLGIFEGYTTEWGEISGGIETQDEGIQVIDNSPTLNFVGGGVTATDGGGGVTTITIPGGTTGVATQDEGISVDTTATTLNFVGAGVVASDAGGGVTTVTITGTGSSNLGDLADLNITTPSDGAIIIYDTTSGEWRDFLLSGDVTMSDTGVVSVNSVQANSVALGTDTTGNYMVDVSAGALIDITHTPAEGSTATIAVDLTELPDMTAAAVGTDELVILDGGTVQSRKAINEIPLGIFDTTNQIALGTDTTGNYVATIAGTANEIEITGSGSETAAVTIGLPNDVTIGNNLTVTGNLIVNGTTTTVNSNTVNIGDNIVVLNADEAGVPSQDAGIEIERGTSLNVTLLWDETSDRWTVGSEDFVAANFIGNLTGNVTGSVTGNADTATALQTARNIALGGDLGGSASFDGTSDITITTTIQTNAVETSMILNDNVTFAKTQNIAQDRILGRITAGSGDIEELTAAQARNVAVAQRQVYVQTTAPGTPDAGDLWFDTDDASLYIYYNDGNSTQWVGISGPAGGGSGSSPFVDTGTYVYYGGPRNVGIGTATPSEALEVVGNILASGDVTAYSDERLKKNIETIENAVHIIKQLRGVKFRRKSDMAKSVGLVAQEVQEVLPEVVRGDNETGYLSVAYGNVVGVLVEAVKEQQVTIDSQEARIARLEDLVAKLMEK